MMLEEGDWFDRMREVMHEQVQMAVLLDGMTEQQALNRFLNQLVYFQLTAIALTHLTSKDCVNHREEFERLRQEVCMFMSQRVTEFVLKVQRKHEQDH